MHTVISELLRLREEGCVRSQSGLYDKTLSKKQGLEMYLSGKVLA
jgi:hypothetical protein